MGFMDDLQKLSLQVNERKNHISNEEMTKHSLIIPFLQTLGFDVFNPLEIRPEYIADFGKKKGEKVDYAIFKDSQVIFFLEAKSVQENLNNHDAQLSRYFNAVSEVKLAILTNGLEYRFYTDLENSNMMDEKPFYILDILNIKESDVQILNNFRKESFNKDSLMKYAEELVYTSNLNSILKDLLRNPSDDFVRLLIRDFSNTRITTNVIEKFKPFVKNAIHNAILDIVNKGLSQQTPEINKSVEEETPKVETIQTNDSDSKKREIVTTEEELEGFEIIKNILTKNSRNITAVSYKDTVDYFGIFNKNVNHWFIRFFYNSETNKHIAIRLYPEKVTTEFPDVKYRTRQSEDNVIRVDVSGNIDLSKYEKLIIKSFDENM